MTINRQTPQVALANADDDTTFATIGARMIGVARRVPNTFRWDVFDADARAHGDALPRGAALRTLLALGGASC